MLDHRIDTFLVLCDCMNYRKAAEVLQLTQPAVTQQIQHLERLYGCKLFPMRTINWSKQTRPIFLKSTPGLPSCRSTPSGKS